MDNLKKHLPLIIFVCALAPFLWLTAAIINKNLAGSVRKSAHAGERARTTPVARITSTASTSRSSSVSESWEHKLAMLNKGTCVSPSDPTVRQFRRLLDKIGSKSGYSDQKIAEMTFAAHDMVRRAGDRISLLRFMDEAWKTYSIDSGVKYEEILAAVVVIVRGN